MAAQHSSRSRALSRRGLLRIGGGLAVAGAAAGTAAAVSADPGGGREPQRARERAAFTHPGMLHSAAELDRAKQHVAAGDEPWAAGWQRLKDNRHAAAGWAPRPVETVVRGGAGQNYAQLYHDIHAAYQNALRYRVGGTAEHGDTAREILNAWSGTLKGVAGNADRFLASGLYGWQFANAAELMRGYDGFDLGRFQSMLTTVFQPLCEDFLRDHNDACVTNYWANWDLCNTAALLSFGILTDDSALFDKAVGYAKNGEGNGSIPHAVPFLHDGGLGQWQESGRDQGHTMMGMGQLGALCEMAWNQGADLYGFDDNRFMKAAQYVAKYNLGEDVPFAPYRWGSGQNCAPQQHTAVSAAGRGEARPVWALLDHHYAGRRGLDVPHLTAYARKTRPEGGGGDYGTASGAYDQLGFGTLLHSR
ncbi:alginate lyase family protein [Streptomyces iconiensis]|uniref:Alginate lyase family protein n=1 Tax=Streptomyces iconiensis TaxID=1384038 RepID=A0ABT7A0U3_9ACTN|nr:alginate lyase family protein [Streptomyces iconiensis]MDJ1134944.1 alginate lyase family protein [Streptomyces iconiensis]